MPRKSPITKRSVTVTVIKVNTSKQDESSRTENRKNHFVATITKDRILPFPDAFCREHNIELGDKLQCLLHDDGVLLLLPPVNKRPEAYSKILKLAIDVFENPSVAARWLHRAQYGLGNKRPTDVMRTARGAMRVTALLGQIKYAVPT